MKRKGWLCTLLAAVMVAMLVIVPNNVRAAEGDESDGSTSDNGMTITKTVDVNDDGTYNVNLEGFATGKVDFSEKTVPVDLILVLDVSGSMDGNINTYKYTARNRQGYTYNSYGNNTYYYKDGDNYYPVSRTRYYTQGSYSRVRALYYTKGSTTYYLSGTGTTTTAPSSPTNDGGTIWTGVLYTRSVDSTQKKIDALHTAVNGFIDVVADKNQEVLDKDADAPNSDLSRVSIVKFAGNSRDNNYNYTTSTIGNNTYQDGGYTYNYTQVVKDMTVVKKSDLTSGVNWHKTVNDLTARGATAADYGMGYANKIYNNHKNDFTERQTVVVMFTDGTPTHGNSWNNAVARDSVNSSKSMKDNGVKVFTVAVLEGADPALDPTASGTSNENQYLHAVSSNYPSATAANNGWNVTWGDRAKKEDGTNADYYYAAESAEQLSSIFTAIAESSSSTSTTVGAQSVMRDIVSSSFTLPEGATEDKINVAIVPWDSTTHNWSETTKYTITQWANETAAGHYSATAQENVSVEISEDGKTIDVKGFDYAGHFLATDKADEDRDGVNKQAAKIVITFEIDATPSAITGASVATNGAASGIYLTEDAEEAVIYFPVPEVTFTPVTYVVDYVTSDTSTDTKASSIKLDYQNVLNNVQMLDDPSDDVLKGDLATAFDYTIYKGKYGTISYGDDAIDVQRRYVRYAPTTMDWNDYDRIFIKGESATESDLDVWAMLAVLPANSVYYEDTYITQTKTVTYNDNPVDIEYTGITYNGNWTTDGTEGTNQTQHADAIMGWIDGMADDTTYSNGMAHTSSASGASANFTFSGTGVDIYSRTDGATGTILVTLTGTTKDGTKVAKSKKIDNKAASGTYYQIPTCTFTDLEYGTYKVTIYVTSAAKDRLTYYLDGIRVYNPIQPHEDEELVQEIYGEKNLGAVFTEVRSLLVDREASIGSAVYIDEHTTDDGAEIGYDTAEIATYEKEGPKAEIYLDKGQSVAISVESGKTYYIGLKEISGDGTTAVLNGAAKDISHTSDLYYDVTPTSGNTITVTNTGDGILSITKLRTSNGATENPTNGTLNVSPNSLLKAFRSIAANPVEDYTDDVISAEEAETPVIEDTDITEEEEVVSEETVLTEEDITINNPSTEDAAVTEEKQEVQKETTTNDWYGYLSSFFNFFRRGRY